MKASELDKSEDATMPTLSDFACKKDWGRAQLRWDAFWALEAIDRPCLSILVPRENQHKPLFDAVEDYEAKWMDPDILLDRARMHMASFHFLGEAVPSAPGIMAATTTGCGDHLEFHEAGISIRPSMNEDSEFIDWHPGKDDPWRPKVETILNRLLDECRGSYIVMHAGQYPHLDLLTMIRGNTESLLDMALAPERCKTWLTQMRPLAHENFEHFRRIIDARQGNVGYTCWTGVWSREFFLVSQADMSASISSEMFKNLVLPELDDYGETYGRLHYHTCGYKQHLEACLSRSYIRGFQYSPNKKEAPNGPTHMDFYRRIQEAKRCLDLEVLAGDVEYLIRHLRPEGLHIATRVNTIEQAQELLDQAIRWAGTHAASA